MGNNTGTYGEEDNEEGAAVSDSNERSEGREKRKECLVEKKVDLWSRTMNGGGQLRWFGVG